MAEVKRHRKNHWNGLDADRNDVPAPSIGDTYSSTDNGKHYYWNGSAWKRGLVETVVDHTWEGDDANNREIDLGDEYDFIQIFEEEAKASNVDHLGMAWAFKTYYGGLYNIGGSSDVRHTSMASTDVQFQGKMTGVDSTKIKLGSSGNLAQGTNFLNMTYRLIGFKFQDMV